LAGIKPLTRGRAQVHDKDGKLLFDSGWIHNLAMNAGLQSVCKCIGYGLAGTPFRYLALGSSNAANTNPAQTALGAEISTLGLSRAEATVTNPTTTTTGDTTRFVHQWTASGDATIEEVGIFDTAVTGGVMLGRLLTGSIALHNLNTFTYTYDIILVRV